VKRFGYLASLLAELSSDAACGGGLKKSLNHNLPSRAVLWLRTDDRMNESLFRPVPRI
jgi:hypothetical protein